MKKKFRHKMAFGIIRPIFYLYLRVKYHFKAVRFKNKNLKGPYLILGNHTLAFDPFFLTASFREPIYFVATDLIFTKPLLSKAMMYLVSPISKAKYKTDSDTVKNIIKMVKSGGSIGIFPEGNTSYYGGPMSIPFSTAKLIKLLKIPVLFYRIEGGYLTKPRWAKNKRKGRIDGYVFKVFEKDTYEKMSLEEINDVINESLNVNAFEVNKQKKINFIGKDKANYIETAFFVSPATKSLNQIYSSGDDVFEMGSDFHVRIDDQGKFNNLGGTAYFNDTIGWHDYQQNVIDEMIDDKFSDLIGSDKLQMNLLKKKKITRIDDVKLCLYYNRIEIIRSEATEIIKFEDISAHVQYTNTLLIHSYITNKTYYFTPFDTFNAFKYVLFSKSYKKKVLADDNEL